MNRAPCVPAHRSVCCSSPSTDEGRRTRTKAPQWGPSNRPRPSRSFFVLELRRGLTADSGLKGRVIDDSGTGKNRRWTRIDADKMTPLPLNLGASAWTMPKCRVSAFIRGSMKHCRKEICGLSRARFRSAPCVPAHRSVCCSSPSTDEGRGRGRKHRNGVLQIVLVRRARSSSSNCAVVCPRTVWANSWRVPPPRSAVWAWRSGTCERYSPPPR